MISDKILVTSSMTACTAANPLFSKFISSATLAISTFDDSNELDRISP